MWNAPEQVWPLSAQNDTVRLQATPPGESIFCDALSKVARLQSIKRARHHVGERALVRDR